MKVIAVLCVIASAQVLAQSPPASTPAQAGTEQRHDRPSPSQQHANDHQGTVGTAKLVGSADRAAPDANRQAQQEQQAAQGQGEKSWGVAEWSALIGAVGSLITAVFTVMLGIFTKRLWITSRDTARITEASLGVSQRSVDVSERALATSEGSLQLAEAASIRQSRAYLYLTHLQMVYNSISDGGNLFEITVMNFGATPASLDYVSWEATGNDIDYSMTGDGWVGRIIGSGEKAMLRTTLHVDEGMGNLIHEGKAMLLITCQIDYTDVTETRRTQRQDFAFIREPYGFQRSPGLPYEQHQSDKG